MKRLFLTACILLVALTSSWAEVIITGQEKSFITESVMPDSIINKIKEIQGVHLCFRYDSNPKNVFVSIYDRFEWSDIEPKILEILDPKPKGHGITWEQYKDTGHFIGKGVWDFSCIVAYNPKTQVMTYNLGEDEITVKRDEKEKYIEVKTNNATFRIYPCGKVEKHTEKWEEINPNEDARRVPYTYLNDFTDLTIPVN